MPDLFFPDHRNRHVKSALLHVISLARLACVHTWAWPPEALTRAPAGKEIKAKRRRSHHLTAAGLRARIRHLVVADNTR